jgi:transcriptional regulator, malT family
VTSLLIVLVGVVVTVVVLVNRNNAATTPNETGSPSASAKPVDPLAAAVPAVTDLSGSVSGSEVTFTWTNPDPQQGDRFRYAVRDPRGGSVSELTSETTVTVTALAGDTCLEVHLVRLNGRESQPATVCAP